MAEQNIDKGHDYGLLVAELGRLIESSRSQIEEAIRVSMLRLYWDLGRQIVEFEQKGKSRAAYSTQLVVELSRDLVLQYGKGFSASNLYNMRLFYQRYPIFQTSGKLSWGHYCELAPIDDDLERSFYEKQCALEENGESDHSNIGQMNMYMGYFAAEENTDGDNPPIGIVLAQDKNDLVVKYATSNLNSQLFVSKYQLYLPNEAELRAKLEAILTDPNL